MVWEVPVVEGRYRLTGLPTLGEARLALMTGVRVRRARRVYDPEDTPGRIVWAREKVRLLAGQVRADVQVDLVPVRVRVTRDGRPARRVRIRAYRRGLTPVRAFATAEEGVRCVLAAGRWLLRAGPATRDRATSPWTWVEVSPAGPREVVLPLLAPQELEGVVLDPAGKPAARVAVVALAAPVKPLEESLALELRETHLARTDGGGRFHFRRLGRGPYGLLVQLPRGSPCLPPPTRIVAPETTRRVTLRLRRAVPVEVTITATGPLPEFTVCLVTPDPPRNASSPRPSRRGSSRRP